MRGWQLGMRWAAPGVAILGLAAATAAGCLVELDRTISCGDGFVDRAAGEECDPAVDVERWMTLCADGIEPTLGPEDCDPESCAITVAAEQACAVCGNGVREGKEECDLEDFGGEVCKEPGGKLLCRGTDARRPCTIDRSLCHCGDGVFQPELEDCEFRFECLPTDLAACANVGGECDFDQEICVSSPFGLESPDFSPPLCTDLDDGIDWGGGELRPLQHCTSSCEWNTAKACTMCGNGSVDPGEACDGEANDPAAKQSHCAQVCAGQPLSIALDCASACASNCEFESDPNMVVDPEQYGCCVIREERCSADFPCCAGLSCQTVAVGPALEQRCVP